MAWRVPGDHSDDETPDDDDDNDGGGVDGGNSGGNNSCASDVTTTVLSLSLINEKHRFHSTPTDTLSTWASS